MKSQVHVLIIDDDQELCGIIKNYLKHNGYTATAAYTGAKGLKLAAMEEYQLIILDIMLPDINGLSILREIRRSSVVPILMLTAKNEEADKIEGLQRGADDYLTKPFSMQELIARVNSLIRRYVEFNPGKASIGQLQLQHLFLDAETRKVIVDGKMIELTGKEFDLLYFLASQKGRVFTKKQIYTQVWQENYLFDDGNIMSFISKLRRKIEPVADQPFFIQTVHGVGYRFNKEG